MRREKEIRTSLRIYPEVRFYRTYPCLHTEVLLTYTCRKEIRLEQARNVQDMLVEQMPNSQLFYGRVSPRIIYVWRLACQCLTDGEQMETTACDHC